MKARDRYFVDGVICNLADQAMRVANLSTEGLFAVTNRPPAPGRVVILELLLGNHDVFQVVCEITWVNDPVKPTTANLPSGFGARILRMAGSERMSLQDFVRRADAVLSDSPGRPRHRHFDV